MNKDLVEKIKTSIDSGDYIKDISVKDGYLEVKGSYGQTVKVPIDDTMMAVDIDVTTNPPSISSVTQAKHDTIADCYAMGIDPSSNALKADSAAIYAKASDSYTMNSNFTAAKTAASYYDNSITADNANGVSLQDTINSLKSSVEGNLSVRKFDISDINESVFKKYFIEDEKNFDLIAREFAGFYISRITSVSAKQKICVNFFGLKDDEIAVYIDMLDSINTSIKGFFENAAAGAKKQGFSELFGPVVCDMTVDWYIDMIEDQGLFYPELYDGEEFKRVLKRHNFPRKQLLTPETQREMREMLEKIQKATEEKAPYEIHESKPWVTIDDNPWKEYKPYVYPINVPFNPNTTSPWWGIYPPSTSEPMYPWNYSTNVTTVTDQAINRVDQALTSASDVKSWYNSNVGVFASDAVVSSGAFSASAK